MPEPITNPITRRSILLGGAALGTTALAAAGSSGSLARAATTRGAGRPKIPGPYFNLGVASGDPVPDGVVLWTRLAPNATAEDGMGGMPNKPMPVEWELATDEKFSKVVQSGTVDAVPELGHSVHIEASGLSPGAEYFYRFRVEGNLSDTGRTRTAPAPDAMGELTMCFASCSHWEHGYFTAYRRMAEDEPGLILHLGDYLYEYKRHAGSGPDSGFVRAHPNWENTTLAHYRQRHALYKTDLDLQAAHAAAPWLVVFDDHEVENNWADEIPEDSSHTPGEEFLARRKAAFQAYYENMPLRARAKPDGIDMRLYRRIHWGSLATFHMLDTRQYRDDQCEGSNCDPDDPDRTMTGSAQEKWLLDGFNNSRARWDVLGQQVFFARRDFDTGSGENYNLDAWDGYTASRDRIAEALGNTKVRNGVVLTGDVHRHWAAEIKQDFDNPDSPNTGVELVTTSISSNGDGDPNETNQPVMDENPHVKYYKHLRGYVRTRFSASELRAEFRTLNAVSEKGSPATTDRSFTVADGNPALG